MIQAFDCCSLVTADISTEVYRYIVPWKSLDKALMLLVCTYTSLNSALLPFEPAYTAAVSFFPTLGASGIHAWALNFWL